MQTQEVAIKSKVKVILKSDAEMLDEVVVVAYGAAKKSSLTGSVEIVKADQLTKVPVNSMDQALQGKAAGVQVVATSGRPGAGANVKIRGTSSINAGTDPLYVIDGIPVSASAFSALNSEDIEYMSILKDASATAIYGSRGANGVVLITTKKGKTGKAVFNLRAQFGITTRTRNDEHLMNTQEKLTYERQLGVGKGKGMTDEEIANYPINTNWIDEVFRTGFTQSYELSMNGGTEATKFYVSAQFFDQDAIIPGSYLTRGNGRINLEHKVNDRLKFGVNTSVGVSKEGTVRSDRNVLNPFNYVYSANPYTKPYNDDGSYAIDATWDYQLNVFENIYNNPSNTSNIKAVAAANLEWNIWDEIKYTTVLGIDYNQAIAYQYNKPESRLSAVLNSKGYRHDAYTHSYQWVWTNMLSYDKTFNSVHNVKLVLAEEASATEYKTFSASGDGFPNGKLDAMDIAASPNAVDGYTSQSRLLSFMATAGYTYDGKYIIDGAVRRDGSSRFGTNNQYGTFWAVGLGWNMERERFMENVEFINKLKIRGSVGTSGNNSIGNYAAQGVYGYGSYNNLSTSYPKRLANPDLTWEKNLQASVGFDVSFFDSRLNATFDYYNRKTTDMLLATNLSQTTGFSSRIDNVGEMKNSGVEIAVNGDVVRTNDWTFSLNGMFSYNKNEVTKLYEGQDIETGYNGIITEGERLNTYKLVRWAGVNPQTGDALYYTKDGQITNVYNGDDAVVLSDKTPDPKYFGSFGTRVSWKGLELSADFYYAIGGYIYNNVSYFMNSDGKNATKNQHTDLLYKQWKNPGDVTNIPRQDRNNNVYSTTRFLEDGSYIRLRNVTLSYTLPKNLLKSVGISNARVYAQGLNLLTFTNFTGSDPEIGNAPNYKTSEVASGSINDYNFPAARTIMFGIEVGF